MSGRPGCFHGGVVPTGSILATEFFCGKSVTTAPTSLLLQRICAKGGQSTVFAVVADLNWIATNFTVLDIGLCAS